MISITVIVPTYRRPCDLARCLEALNHQERSVDEAIVVVRDTDSQTWDFLQTFEAGRLGLVCSLFKIFWQNTRKHEK